MLTTVERQRLEAALPVTTTVDWEYEDTDDVIQQVSVTIDPALIWSGGEQTGEFDDYPVVALGMDSQGGIVTDETPLDSYAGYTESDDGLTITERDEQPQSDTLSFRVAVERRFKDAIPPQVRLEQLVNPIWQWLVHTASNAALNVDSAEGRALTIEPQSSPTPFESVDTLRAEFTATVGYTSVVESEFEAVDLFGVDAEPTTE